MYLRLTAVILSLVILAATHWKAYHAGQVVGQAEYNAAVAAATERYRQREQALVKNVETLSHALLTQKTRNAAIDRAHAERLRQYQDALSRAGTDPRAACGADGPFAPIAGECGAALAAMDAHARELARIAGGLQRYTAEVCLKSQ